MNYPAFTGYNNAYSHMNDNYNDLNSYYNKYYDEFQSLDVYDNMDNDNLQLNVNYYDQSYNNDTHNKRKRNENTNIGTGQNNRNDVRNLQNELENCQSKNRNPNMPEFGHQTQFDQSTYYSSGQNNRKVRKSPLEHNQRELNVKRTTRENMINNNYQDPKKEPMRRTKDPQSIKQQIITNKKTEICKWWENGTCKFGNKCNYAHGLNDIIRKTSIQKGSNNNNYTNINTPKVDTAPKVNKKSNNKRTNRTDFENTETYKKLLDPDNFPVIDSDHYY